MTRKPTIALCLIAALATSACSTKPRKFSATVAPTFAASASPTLAEADAFTTCDGLVRKGHQGNFASAAASSAAGGVAMFGGAAAVAASGTVGMGISSTGYVLSAAVPVLGFAAAFGVNRAIRSGRERKYKRTMTACMQEFGYSVIDWTRVKKKQPATAMLQVAAPTPSAQQDLTPEAPEPANADPVPPISD